MDNIVKQFQSGQHTILEPENIPADASQASMNFTTYNGKVVLVGGRAPLGTEGTIGKITGLHYGYQTNGDKVLYAKFGTIIKYYDGSAWQDVITGLTEDAEYSFTNYSSLAGAFTFINGIDGYYKINNANPTTYLDVYSSTKNFHGKILIDRGRTILWDRNDTGSQDKTGLYGSKIDTQDSYTAVSGESIGALGSTVYSGTLAFAGGTKNCFGLSIEGTVAAGTETFVDNFNGVLTSNYGGTGTINYITGAYSVTFSDTTTGAVTADYQWEDSNVGGLTDFTKASPRIASDGFVFPQDEGGDAILNVLVGQDGAYYSLKENSAYKLVLSADDINATNEIYRKNMGIPNWRCAVSTEKGIMFINTANPTKPQMTILVRNTTADTVEPLTIFKHFDFSDYDFSDSAMMTFDRWAIVFCKKSGSLNNDTMLMCDVSTMSVDVVGYGGRMGVKDEDDLFIGSPLTKSVYQVFDDFDDDGSTIDNFWTGKDEVFGTENLKKSRKLRLKGLISKNQTVKVYVDYDGEGFEWVGSIVGSGTYVDFGTSYAIGGPLVGVGEVGGGESPLSYEYFMELKLKTPKYRKRTIKLEATGYGYFDFNMIMDWDILLFENRLPKAKRSKQNVSLDGLTTNL